MTNVLVRNQVISSNLECWQKQFKSLVQGYNLKSYFCPHC